MGFENEDALEGLFGVEVTERAAFRIADAGTEDLHHRIADLTPVSHDPFRQDPRPPGTLRRSWYRVRVPAGSAPPGEFPNGITIKGPATARVLRGTVATDDRTVLWVEEDTRPHTIRPREDRAPASVIATRRPRGTVQDGRAHLSWVSPFGRVFAREVKHPGTRGAHMQKRAAVIVERDVPRTAAAAMSWWADHVSKTSTWVGG